MNKIPEELKPFEKTIYHYAQKYFADELNDYNDIFQTACIAAMDAIKGFKDGKKMKLNSYVNMVINRKLISLLLPNKKPRHYFARNYKKNSIANADLYHDPPKTPAEELILKEDDLDTYHRNYIEIKRKILNERLNADIWLLTANNNLNKNLFIDKHFNSLTYKDLIVKYNLTQTQIMHRLHNVCCHIRGEKIIGGQNFTKRGDGKRRPNRVYKDKLC